MVENGATPSWTPAQAKEFGFRIEIFSFAAIAPAYDAIKETYIKLKETGKTGIKPDFTPKKLFTIVGLKEATAFDVAAGGSLYARV